MWSVRSHACVLAFAPKRAGNEDYPIGCVGLALALRAGDSDRGSPGGTRLSLDWVLASREAHLGQCTVHSYERLVRSIYISLRNKYGLV